MGEKGMKMSKDIEKDEKSQKVLTIDDILSEMDPAEAARWRELGQLIPGESHHDLMPLPLVRG
jgi:hypothetical protein